MKKLSALLLASMIACTPLLSFATNFEVIPEAKKPDELLNQVDCVGGDISKCQTSTKPGKTVRQRYNSQAGDYDKKGDTGASFATGIFSRDTIIEYIVYIVRFISEIGLVIGAGMIIFAGYKYASAVFTGKSPSMSMVKDAIIGVLIIIFSYAIIKALSAAFL